MSSTDYITIDDVRGYLYQASDDDIAFLTATVIPAACALFDNLCNVRPGFFKEVDSTAADQIFYGNGLSFIPLPPFKGEIESITMPTPYVVPRYSVIGGVRLQALTSDGFIPRGALVGNEIWPQGLPITIKAKWGSDEKVALVKQACAELAVAMWRSKDQAFLKAVQMDTGLVIMDAIPVRVKATIASLRGEITPNAFV